MPRVLKGVMRSANIVLRTGIFIVGVALLSACATFNLYRAEIATEQRIMGNGGLDRYEDVSQTKKVQLRRDALKVFGASFGLSAVAMLVLTGKSTGQLIVLCIASLPALTSFGVKPGGDHKGCEECLMPLVLTLGVPGYLLAGALVWCFIALVVSVTRKARRAQPGTAADVLASAARRRGRD